MADHQLQPHQTSNLYKFITNISNVKSPTDKLTIIINGETILPHHPSVSFSKINNMTSNVTAIGDGTVQTVPNDSSPPRAMPTDIYLVLVIATVSLVVIGLIMYGLYKAFKMFKLSLNDAREDSVPASQSQRRNERPRRDAGMNNSDARNSASNSSLPRSTASTGVTPTGTARRGAGIAALPFFQGIRNLDPAHLFTATLRSTTSTKSDDQPPPYEDELPPPYNEAIKMTIHTREEMCTLRREEKAETTIIKMPSSSNAQSDDMAPSTSSIGEQHPGASVQIVISSPGEPSEHSDSSDDDDSDNDYIGGSQSPSVDLVAVPNTNSDGDETDGRIKTEHLKNVSMTVVL